MKKIILAFVPFVLLAACGSKEKEDTSQFAEDTSVSSQNSTHASSSSVSSTSSSSTTSSFSESKSSTPSVSGWEDLTLNQKIALLIQKGDKEFTAPANKLSAEELYQQDISHEWAMSGTIDKGSILIPEMVSNDIYRISTQGNIVTIEFGNAMVQNKQFPKEELFTEFYGDATSQEKTDILASKVVSLERLQEVIDEKFSAH